MKIILLRHGETEWNALHRYQGHRDIFLNDTGKAQAQILAKHLSENEQVEAIYCSDLSRTYETAAIIADKFGLQTIPDVRLREVSFGTWEGHTFSEVYENNRREFEQWYEDIWNFQIPGGESFMELLERASLAIEEIANQYSGTVIIVTHGGVIKAFLSYLDPSIDIWKIDIGPASMTLIEFEKGTYKILKTGSSVK